MMDSRWAYLIHLLSWAVPFIVLQLGVLAHHFRGRTWAVLRAVLPPALVVGTYLAVADHLAIRAGIWNFGEGKHLGLYLAGVPLEEILFFLLTSVMVSLGLTLFTVMLSRREARVP
ncbi:lycopene cyclase domain-containing protein [Vitiosangium sp. GDMCC 1.1324]|uniref:lycopene cyclase domain-containing protein n=1 Tax=Vitiosangium sp. (strain GDMCC 1.1324) TaxID=2138576 RepID=UPI000D331890|nr:lycopene cyclase domain-containing protein [Vitiosangium sp. GDMCC 1.1324]PTL81714.1 lycopene cyclase domain-containing protein [Vitiosangium sp. GDMCC 1.1324]